MNGRSKTPCSKSYSALALCIALVVALPVAALAQADLLPSPRGSAETVIRALVAAKPTTPVDLIRSARIIVDLGQPAMAKPFVQKLAGTKLDDEAAAALVEEIGSAALLRLGREPALAPEAGQFCNATLEAAQRFARDPARLAALVKQLSGATPYDHATLVAALRPGGEAGVVALVEALANAESPADQAPLREALVQLGTISTAPLMAVLSSRQPALLASVIEVLAALEDPTAADRLLAPALAPDSPAEVAAAARHALGLYFSRLPTASEAAARLLRDGRRSLDLVRHPERLEAAGADPTPLVWQWDDAKRKLTSSRVPAILAHVLAAVQTTADAGRIMPSDADLRRWHLTALAQAIDYAGDDPALVGQITAARAVVSRATTAELQDLLSFALAEDRPAAATVAARQLGESEDASLLYSHNPQPSALVRALAHPSRELRFAALEAIMRLDPRVPYPGASQTAEALEYFARSTGYPKALVGAAVETEAGRLAGLLAEQGYEPSMATDAAGMLRMARAAGDYEVIFVDSELALPSSAQLLQRLRSDSRLARIPLAVVSLAEEFPQVQRVAQRYPLSLAVMRTHNGPGTRFELDRLSRFTGRVIVPGEVRRAQGVQALAWIATLASRRESLYDLRRLDTAVIASLDAPGMTQTAALALGKLDTARAQRALVDLASRPVAPLDDRKAAARAFADSVARRGTLLTSDEILRQYDRYNAGANYDTATQKLLAGLLDTIEARAKADWLALEPTAVPAP